MSCKVNSILCNEDEKEICYNKIIDKIQFVINGVDLKDYIREYYKKELLKITDDLVKKSYRPDLSEETRYREVLIRNYILSKRQNLIKNSEYREKVLKGYYRNNKLDDLLR